MKADVWLDRRGFGLEVNLKVNHDALTEALLRIPTVTEVDGPYINGVMGVIYRDDERSNEDIIKELQRVAQPFIAAASRRRA